MYLSSYFPALAGLKIRILGTNQPRYKPQFRSHSPAILYPERDNMPAKKKPGRPAKKAAAKAPANRGPGRPPKAAAAKAPAKRGHPAKAAAKAPAKKAAAKKTVAKKAPAKKAPAKKVAAPSGRGPGRPPKALKVAPAKVRAQLTAAVAANKKITDNLNKLIAALAD